jgi:hypothetical protein
MAFTLALNFALPLVINRRPERIYVHYRAAWMIVPGRLEVRGLTVRGQGRRDQWLLELDDASAEIDLPALQDRTLHVTSLAVEGGGYRYRRRVKEGATPNPTTPDIPGFTNPPNPAPEDIYPKGVPWRVEVDSAEVEGIRELWLEDYRFAGQSRAKGGVSLGGAEVGGKLELDLGGSQMFLGGAPVADEMTGSIAVDVEHLDRKVGLTRDSVGAVKARASMDTHVQNFDFLDFYLEKVPWLHLVGTGHVTIDASLADGRLTDGSTLRADTRDLAVSFLGYSITGDAVVQFDVGPVDGASVSDLDVQYGEYAIAEDGKPPLVTGKGFLVHARSPDVALDRPFTSLVATLDLPPSDIPDLALFDDYLPAGLGFHLLQAKATVHGNMKATVPDNLASGDLFISSDKAVAKFGSLDMSSGVAIHAHLTEGQLVNRRYDFSGSGVDLDGLVMRDTGDGGAIVVGEKRPWSAKLDVVSGVAAPSEKTLLQADVKLACTDSTPFVEVAASRKPLAGWVQNLLDVPHVTGKARVIFGRDSIDIPSLAIRGGNLEILLRWLRRKTATHATLFARYGSLSLGIGIDGNDREVHLTGARKWYEGAGK